jgi:hypothetical protein
MFSGDTRSGWPTPHQQIAPPGVFDHFEALGSGRSDHHDAIDSRMGLQGVCGADGRVARDEQPDPHVGRTGFQSSSGSV